MKKPHPFFRSLEGTIMIFSLVIILGGTLVLAAWAQMMATRATYTAMTDEGQKRRIALANGRSLARQYILNQMPNTNPFFSIPGTNYTNLPGGWGGFELQTIVNPWLATNFGVGNPFNPISGMSFVATNSVHIFNGVETNIWTFLIRSRSPLLAGFPVVIHAPTDTTFGSSFNWLTNLAVIFSNSVKTNRLAVPTAPVIPFTSGYTASGKGSTNGYLGYFASPMNTNYTPVSVTGLSVTNPSPTGVTASNTNGSTSNNRVTNYTGGSLDIVLDSPQTTDFLRFVIPNVTNGSFTNTTNGTNYITTYTNATVTNVILVSSMNTNTLHLIADTNTTNLTTLTLSGTNNTRRVYVNKAGGNLTLKTAIYTNNSYTNNYANNYTWWLGITFANTNGTLTVTGPTNAKSLTLQGGIRANGVVGMSQGGASNLHVIANSSPPINGTNVSPVELLGDRIMWLEEQRSP